MTTRGDPTAATLSLSHLELYVRDAARMEDFYTRYLGFVVSDRGQGDDGMIFLSRNPREHHQLVLNPRPGPEPQHNPLDHVSFRVGSLAALKRYHRSLLDSKTRLETVSHGNSWSIYFRDPEGNRLEVFAETPWHVNQPCRFEVDLELGEAELLEITESEIRDLPGFAPAEDWFATHLERLEHAAR